MKSKLSFTLLLIVLLGAAAAAAQDYKVVVHSTNTLGSVSRQRLSRILLKKTSRWDDGSQIVPVELLKSSEVRHKLTEDVHRKTMTSIVNYWHEQIFSGRGTPPTEFGTEAELLDFVRVTPGAIGYVTAGTRVGNGIKVLTVTE